MDFSFIGDEQFRNALNSDYQEMLTCHEAGSWKAVHVLAGSIVEALLIEYLVVSSITPNGRDPLTIALNDAVQACANTGVIQKSTASLCDVVRDYRNLIHPGRLIRLNQSVSAEGASIAVNLVSLITREVAEKRKATYGPTAEQILKKLRTDQHSLPLLPQLLSETNSHEKKKFVFSVAPEAYQLEEDDLFSNNSGFLSRLRGAYRQTLDVLTDSEKIKIAERFAKSIREDSAEQIQSYADAFFTSDDIAHLSPQDASITIGYLITRLEQSGAPITEGLFRTTYTIGKFIKNEDAEKLANILTRLVLRQPDKSLKKALDFVETVFDLAREDVQEKLDNQISKLIENSKKNNAPIEVLNRLESISAKWFHIPF